MGKYQRENGEIPWTRNDMEQLRNRKDEVNDLGQEKEESKFSTMRMDGNDLG